MRRALPALLLLAALVLSGLTLHFALSYAAALRDNATIRALHAGRDAEPRPGAGSQAIHARVLFLSWRGRIAEAEALGPALAAAGPGLRSGAFLSIGNARLRTAFELIETNRVDDAIPEVTLAKQAYRAALAAWPGNYDAKVNLDLAMRLVRDMPRPGADESEEPETRPRQLWTDLPGLPRGAP
ncbi:hypothetical protein DSD19_06800 [Rhodovulum sp. BSW8]|uniref:hypothetical protein n=1 Tax=Rhodovulum sp. BSW8 TaxID=2259645 RepID=UPI000DE319E8|nr:hypothetical protein [Rhodovulum sp. BSW8]RBO53822.1 hypothetical protein DSD19_06800 [Rhodovulum sp. BSW8]